MKTYIRKSLNNSGHPLIQLEIMGKLHWFVVDTGSNVNLMSSSLKDELESNLKAVGIQSTSGIGGYTEEGEVFLLPYTLDENQFTDYFTLVNSSTFQVFEEFGEDVSGLLGTSFLLFHRCLLDFSEGCIYLSGKSEEVRSEMRIPA